MDKNRTHQAPDQHSHPSVTGPVTRNPLGQSLDDARKTFRAEWQAKVARKREQAAKSRRTALVVVNAGGKITLVGALCGAAWGASMPAQWGLPSGLLGVTVGFILWFIGLAPSLYASAVIAEVCRQRAERLEQEAAELERS